MHLYIYTYDSIVVTTRKHFKIVTIIIMQDSTENKDYQSNSNTASVNLTNFEFENYNANTFRIFDNKENMASASNIEDVKQKPNNSSNCMEPKNAQLTSIEKVCYDYYCDVGKNLNTSFNNMKENQDICEQVSLNERRGYDNIKKNSKYEEKWPILSTVRNSNNYSFSTMFKTNKMTYKDKVNKWFSETVHPVENPRDSINQRFYEPIFDAHWEENKFDSQTDFDGTTRRTVMSKDDIIYLQKRKIDSFVRYIYDQETQIHTPSLSNTDCEELMFSG